MKSTFRTTLLRTAAVALSLLGLALPTEQASAEPYLAVESGLKCMNCHVNPTGGGKRNMFGTLYARGQIAARVVGAESGRMPWMGDVNTRWLGVGADLRGGYQSVDIPGAQEQSSTEMTRSTVYAEVRLLPNLLSLYVDEKVAPDDVENREAYLLFKPKQGKYTAKVGQLFSPFGLRIEDDNAFVRQSSGLNFNTPDEGIELGLELPKWSAQVAVTEPIDTDSTDRLSLSAVHVIQRWRVGASYNIVDDPLGDRDMLGVFAGWKTGPISWLAELDFITDDTPTGDQDIYATLVEGNWRPRKGHNLKLTYEYLEPDRDRGEDQQERYSLVWEYSPMQFIQARVGMRAYNGIPNFPTSNRDEVFAELHAYF